MKKEELLSRISINSKVMLGKPLIAGTRLTVQYILTLLADGLSIPEIIQEYNELQKEDILACLLYASETLKDISFMPLEGKAV